MLTCLVAATLFLLLGAVIGARRSTRQFDWAGDAFRCRIRACGTGPANWPRLRQRWSRPRWARWENDVLVVRRGPVFARMVSLRATVSGSGVYVLPANDTTRRGPTIALNLRLPEGSLVDLAADDDVRTALVGPYFVAAINGLPQAPVRRRRWT
jgi:hypothetical protein